jgi:hypothetical protein
MMQQKIEEAKERRREKRQAKRRPDEISTMSLPRDDLGVAHDSECAFSLFSPSSLPSTDPNCSHRRSDSDSNPSPRPTATTDNRRKSRRRRLGFLLLRFFHLLRLPLLPLHLPIHPPYRLLLASPILHLRRPLPHRLSPPLFLRLRSFLSRDSAPFLPRSSRTSLFLSLRRLSSLRPDRTRIRQPSDHLETPLSINTNNAPPPSRPHHRLLPTSRTSLQLSQRRRRLTP